MAVPCVILGSSSLLLSDLITLNCSFKRGHHQAVLLFCENNSGLYKELLSLNTWLKEILACEKTSLILAFQAFKITILNKLLWLQGYF